MKKKLIVFCSVLTVFLMISTVTAVSQANSEIVMKKVDELNNSFLSGYKNIGKFESADIFEDLWDLILSIIDYICRVILCIIVIILLSPFLFVLFVVEMILLCVGAMLFLVLGLPLSLFLIFIGAILYILGAEDLGSELVALGVGLIVWWFAAILHLLISWNDPSAKLIS